MSILEAVILGLVQGLTEFIPVSSSGHLVLLHEVIGVTENGLVFDVALHFGTLMALLVYFRKDIQELILGIMGKNDLGRIAWLILIATIPAAFAGILLEEAAETAFRSSGLVAFNLLIMGFIMLAAEKYAGRYERKTPLKRITLRQSLAVGIAQAVAIVPGISRSGATITSGLFMGIDRVAATRFSFLLGIPIMCGAVARVLIDGEAISLINEESQVFIIGTVTAMLSGVFAIKFLLRYLARHTLSIFAYYRIGLGVFVLMLATLF